MCSKLSDAHKHSSRPVHKYFLHLLNVAEESHTPQNPVIRVSSKDWSKGCSQIYNSDVGEVSAPGLLVDRARVELGVLDVISRVDGVEVNDREWSEEHLCWWLCELASSLIPASSVQEQSMNIDSLGGRMVDVFFHEFGDVVLQDDAVQSPTLVGASHLYM